MSHNAFTFRRFPVAAAAPWLAAAAFLAAAASGAGAQSSGPCQAEPAADGPQIVLRCGRGLTIEVEETARYSVVDQDGDGTPEGMRLNRGAALVDADPAAAPRFQILTPTAIASVRGTEWAVDAAAATTSVFVVSGAVNVVARDTNAGVVLRQGEGTDVPAGATELRAVRWGQGRIDALFARFGR